MSGAEDSKYTRAHVMGSRRREAIARMLAELIPVDPAWPVIEYGCGSGANLLALARAYGGGVRIIGVDPDPLALEIARQTMGLSYPLIRARMEDHVLAPSCAQMAVLSFVLHRVRSVVDGLAGVLHSLRPGGRVVVVTLSHRQIRNFCLRDWFPDLVEANLHRYPCISKLSQEIADVGFGDVDVQDFVHRFSWSEVDFSEFVLGTGSSNLARLPLGERERRLADFWESGKGKLERGWDASYTVLTATRPSHDCSAIDN